MSEQQPGTEDQVSKIIDETYPPGSEKRRLLDAAAEDAMRLLAEHGYGHLLKEPGEVMAGTDSAQHVVDGEEG